MIKLKIVSDHLPSVQLRLLLSVQSDSNSAH